jgi:hypothetical protein
VNLNYTKVASGSRPEEMLYYEDVKDLGGTTTPTSFWRDGSY